MDSIPRNDAGALQWLQAFAATAQGDPRAAGLTGEEVATLATLTSEFEQAYMTASDPSTGTRPSIARKNAARAAAIEHARQVIKQIDANPSITDITRFALGLKPKPDRSAKPRPIDPPVTAPVLTLLMIAPDGTYTFAYADSHTPESRKKPEGVKHLQVRALFRDRHAPPNQDPGPAHALGAYTKSPFCLTFPAEQRRKVAMVFGRWQTASGLSGPWSLPVEVTAV